MTLVHSHFDLVRLLLVQFATRTVAEIETQIISSVVIHCTSKEKWTKSAFLFWVTHLIKIFWNVREMNSSAGIQHVDATRGQSISKSRLASRRFSKKTNERIWFSWHNYSTQQKKTNLFIFWENLQRSNMLTILSDLYVLQFEMLKKK